jgi:Zn-dependent peptidase ImmA (M78 family)
MRIAAKQLIIRPDSATDISEIAERLLRQADARGNLPTPIDDLIEAAKVRQESDTEGTIHRFASMLDEGARSIFRSAFQKLRGIADMRQRAIYVPQDKPPRALFAKSHELGHQVLPWQHVNTTITTPLYCDDDKTLSPEARALFDIEANFFASEVIFQGRSFTFRARDYQPSFDAVFLLADEHGASRESTLHRFVQEQDDAIAAVSYLPSKFETDSLGFPVLRAPRVIPSPKFLKKYSGVEWPDAIRSCHPWAAARDFSQIMDGCIDLNCDGQSMPFQWYAWWNSYRLLILVRRKPSISLSQILQKSKQPVSIIQR